jgi:hypothetical protein
VRSFYLQHGVKGCLGVLVALGRWGCRAVVCSTGVLGAHYELLSTVPRSCPGCQQGFADWGAADGLMGCRDKEIQQIARSIEELSQIFKELAILVIDQGTILDRIDYNMEQVVGGCHDATAIS